MARATDTKETDNDNVVPEAHACIKEGLRTWKGGLSI